MPHFDIIRESTPPATFRVASVMGTYDLQTRNIREHFEGDLSLPNNWQVGLIVGASGTGKTTIAKELFPDAYIERFEYTQPSILDDMPKNASMSDITRAFTSVGFASVQSWLKPYAVLSNGEKMRCDLARAILSNNDLFVFDEFTSVVDRNVAKIGSFAMQKAIRKTKKRFIAVTCHYDVEDWLLPDWVFDTDTMTFRSCDGLKKNRPVCKLDIYETKAKDYYWRVFRKHHYLNHTHNNAARVFVATINGDLCAYLSILYFCHPSVRNAWRVHRLVTLPDYQGLGIGARLLDWVASQNKKQNRKTLITTSNPAIINSLRKNELWRITRCSRESSGSGSGIIQNKHIKGSTSCARITIAASYK